MAGVPPPRAEWITEDSNMKDMIENLISDCILAVGLLMIALVPAVMIVGVMAIAMLI